MNLKELRNFDKDDILEMMGLQTKSSTGAWLAGHLGLEPGDDLLFKDAQKPVIDRTGDDEKGLAVHGVDPVIGSAAQTSRSR